MNHSFPPNRLASQTSPYLLQHAHNPVRWWPWGEEAFAEARRRQVPIFLSIGYSTCYWCHVMEREVFENEHLAALLDRDALAVKVDREERPDIDDIYMTATQLMTGHGGWPMSVFLEPWSLRPFWCGTYIPPEGRHGLPGFGELLAAISRAWRERRPEIIDQAQSLAQGVRDHLATPPAPTPIGRPQIEQLVRELLQSADRSRGGFGGAPKFPQPAFLDFLLDCREAADPQTAGAIDAVVRPALDAMSIGGLHDHVGGGFHRYCVDADWTVPHFEKMLYDNAQLLGVYARAAGVYDDPWYARAARRTIAYVARELAQPDGGFSSAQDAEVDGREGLNYLWTPEEVRASLRPDLADLATLAFSLDHPPNFRDPHHPAAPPAHVLRLRQRPTDDTHALDAIGDGLLRVRSKRRSPRLDDKVLTGWNALMIHALARAADDLLDDSALELAVRAATFALEVLAPREGGVRRVRRSWRLGVVGGHGFLEDAGGLALSLARLARSLARAGRPAAWAVSGAMEVLDAARTDFRSPDGRWYDTRDGQSDLFVRIGATHDGATPSGQALALGAMIELRAAPGLDHHIRRDLEREALALLASMSGSIAAMPRACPVACSAMFAMLRSGLGDCAGETFAFGAPSAGTGRAADQAGARSALPPEVETAVEIFADQERVALAPGEAAEVSLLLRIAPGCTIAAADADESDTPLRVMITGGTGITAFADYPPGEPFSPEMPKPIHRGEVALRVAVEREGPWTGRPILALRYQACTESMCLPPVMVELDIALDPA